MPKLRDLLDDPPQERGDAETQIRDLRNYIIRIVDELQYLLTHLEADNTNTSLWEEISDNFPPYTGLPVMDGAASPGSSNRWARGNHRHPTDTTRASQDALTAHTGSTNNPHGVTKTQVGLGSVANVRQYSADNPPPTPTAAQVGAIPSEDKGASGGVAELDEDGQVPTSQLPALLELGETESTAYRGDRGATAYSHSQASGNPHGTTAQDIGAAASTDLTAHKGDTANPHSVTKTQVGLGNVDNVRQYSADNPPPVPAAADIEYDNTASGLAATDIQAAIDELAAAISGT